MASKPQFVGERVRLGELISKAAVVRSGNGSYPVYSMTMHDGIVKQAGRFKKTIASKDTSAYKVVKRNQLVVGFPIDEGVLYVQNFDEPGIMSPAYSVWDINLDRVLPDYLDLVLHSPQCMAYYKEKMRGTTARRRTLTSDGLRSLEIPLPSIQQQRCVVGIMATVKLQINHARSVINQIDSLVKSRFVEMFGTAAEPKHPVVELESVCSAIVDCPHETPKYEGELVYPAIRTSELQNAAIEWSTMRYVSAEEYQKRIKRLRPLPGDIVYAREGTYGEAVMLPPGFEFCLGQRTMLFRANKEMCIPEYLLHSIVSADVKRQADELNVGSTVPHVNVRDAKRFKIMLPSKTDQQEFADFVAHVDKPRFVAHGGSYLVQENRHLPRGSSVSPSFSKACFMS